MPCSYTIHPSIHPSIHLLTAFPLQGPIWAFIGSVPWQHSECVLASLLILAHLLTFVCNWGLNQEHSTSQSSPIQTKLSPPQSYHHPRATTMHTTNRKVLMCQCDCYNMCVLLARGFNYPMATRIPHATSCYFSSRCTTSLLQPQDNSRPFFFQSDGDLFTMNTYLNKNDLCFIE